jgi:hypothetical protein
MCWDDCREGERHGFGVVIAKPDGSVRFAAENGFRRLRPAPPAQRRTSMAEPV